jgi:anti-anti-sigma factor
MTGPRPEISDRLPPPFSVALSGGGAHPLLATVAGDVDIATAAGLADAVLAALADSPSSGVVLDFTNVGFMDSSGLRAVLGIASRLDAGPAGLVLLSPNRPVRKLLSLAGLDEHMPIATTLADAQAMLAQPRPPASA